LYKEDRFVQGKSKNMDIELFIDEVIEIENQFYEVKGLPKGEYNSQAVQYDTLISNGLYNRIMWGNSPKDYADFL